MNIHLFDIGCCAYCGAPREDWDGGHINKCKALRQRVRDDNNPVKLLKRIVEAVEPVNN